MRLLLLECEQGEATSSSWRWPDPGRADPGGGAQPFKLWAGRTKGASLHLCLFLQAASGCQSSSPALLLPCSPCSPVSAPSAPAAWKWPQTEVDTPIRAERVLQLGAGQADFLVHLTELTPTLLTPSLRLIYLLLGSCLAAHSDVGPGCACALSLQRLFWALGGHRGSVAGSPTESDQRPGPRKLGWEMLHPGLSFYHFLK